MKLTEMKPWHCQACKNRNSRPEHRFSRIQFLALRSFCLSYCLLPVFCSNWWSVSQRNDQE